MYIEIASVRVCKYIFIIVADSKHNGSDTFYAKERSVRPHSAGSRMEHAHAAKWQGLLVHSLPPNILSNQSLTRPASPIIHLQQPPELLLISAQEAVGAGLKANVQCTPTPICSRQPCVYAGVIIIITSRVDSAVHISAESILHARLHLFSKD